MSQDKDLHQIFKDLRLGAELPLTMFLGVGVEEMIGLEGASL